jgi:ribonuclease VapC
MVVDSSALVAIFRSEPDAALLVGLIDRADVALISAVTVVETVMVLCGRNEGAARGRAEAFLASLGLEIVPVDDAQSRAALDAYFAYGRGRHPASLNFGDCFAYALAKSRDLPLLFKGDDFARTDIVPARPPEVNP